MNDRLPAIEPDTRDLLAAVRDIVKQFGADHMRMNMQFTDAERGLYAVAVLEQLFPERLAPLVAAHDALAAALNDVCPGVPPVISLSTEHPA